MKALIYVGRLNRWLSASVLRGTYTHSSGVGSYTNWCDAQRDALGDQTGIPTKVVWLHAQKLWFCNYPAYYSSQTQHSIINWSHLQTPWHLHPTYTSHMWDMNAGNLLTGQLLNGQLLTGNLLTGHLLTTLKDEVANQWVRAKVSCLGVYLHSMEGFFSILQTHIDMGTIS